MQVKQEKFNPNSWTAKRSGKIAMSKSRTTGLSEIPGTERKMIKDKIVTPLPVIIGGKEYRICSYIPNGGITLGNELLYEQLLNAKQIFPITDQPILANFGDFLQVLG